MRSNPYIQGLYTIADNTFRPELTPVQLAEAFLEGGCRLIQLRVKCGMRNAECGIKDYAHEIIKFKKEYNFTFIINDYVDIAMEVGADGVHVGKDDMPIAEVRGKVGDKMLVGFSSHSLEEALQAQDAGADYVAFGAIFPSKTKGPGHPVQGLEKLKEVVEALHIPVVAIGGINRDNFQSVCETRVSAIAMITALTKAPDIVQATRFFTSPFLLLPSYYRTNVPAYQK